MSGLAVDIVKRQGKRPSERFDSKKLQASVYAACLSVRSPEGHAHETAKRVCTLVISWCDNKSEITSADIRRQAAKALETFHPEAAYLYQHHRVIL
jgi:transcriptional regulator NrdR family protein